MPLIELTYPAGALTPEDRTALAGELTTKMLHWEGAPDNDFFRGITWIHVNELPGELVYSAGKPVEQPVFRVNVSVPEGGLSERRKEGLVGDFTAAIREASGLGEEDGLRIWVLIRDVPEGNWGAAGKVVRFEQLREAAKASREQAPA